MNPKKKRLALARHYCTGVESMAKVKFTSGAMRVLFSMIQNPYILTAGQPLPGNMTPYKPADSAEAYLILSLVKWVKKNSDEIANGAYNFKDTEAKLPKHAIERIKAIMKYYEPLGMQVVNCQQFMELHCAVEGQSLDSKIEDFDSEPESDSKSLPQPQETKALEAPKA